MPRHRINTLSSPSLSFGLPLARWAEWDADTAPASLPTLDFIEPLARRRLSSLAKMSLWVAHGCAHDRPQARMIYCSRHGDLAKTTEMLKGLALDEPPSPAAFSMSVLNASIGLYSIVQGNRTPATALSAGATTLSAGLIEAYVQWRAHSDEAILLIHADEPVPPEYGEPAAGGAHALALLFEAGAETTLQVTRELLTATPLEGMAPTIRASQATSANAATPTNPTQAHSLMHALRERAHVSDGCWENAEERWHWSFS